VKGKKSRKSDQAEPFLPVERTETIRQRIMSLLERTSLSAKELSKEIMVSEKDIYGHLEHIQKTSTKRAGHLIITPAQCRKCGFQFKKRDKITKPGKCPICKSELIQEPYFSMQKAGKSESLL
jgi:transcriptional regulator